MYPKINMGEYIVDIQAYVYFLEVSMSQCLKHKILTFYICSYCNPPLPSLNMIGQLFYFRDI